jgi:glycerophosphoryl diester phosphodiesterase
VVVCHDDTVDRCTDGQGPVAALSLAAVKRLDAGFRFTPDGGKTFPFRGRGVQVPTLAEVMERFPEARLNFEVKDHREEIEPRVAELVRRHRRADLVCLGSADDTQAIRLRERLPEVCHFFPEGAVRCHVMAAKSGSDATGCLGGFDVMDLPLRAEVGGMSFEVVDAGTMAWFKAREIPVHVWTVDEEADMRLALSLGVDAIMTDRPDRLAKVMGRAPRG